MCFRIFQFFSGLQDIQLEKKQKFIYMPERKMEK